MAFARSVAVAGSISPALLAPSVTSTTTRLLACERRSRVSEVARPEPIAVPSGSISSCTSSSCRSRTAVSVVGGDLVRLRPANTTRPTRSRRAALDELGHHLLRHRQAVPRLEVLGRHRARDVERHHDVDALRGHVLAQRAVLRPRQRHGAQDEAERREHQRQRDAAGPASPAQAARAEPRPGTTRRAPPCPARAARPRAAPAGPAARPTATRGPGSGSRPSPSGGLPSRLRRRASARAALRAPAPARAPTRGAARPRPGGPRPSRT